MKEGLLVVKDDPSKLDTLLEGLEHNTPLPFLRATFLSLLTREVYSTNGFRTNLRSGSIFFSLVDLSRGKGETKNS